MSPITQTKIPLSDEWATPVEVFDPLHAEFGFTVDAAAAEWNAKLPRFWDKTIDGLRQNWFGEVVWCNPPYSDIGGWLAKAVGTTWSRSFPATAVCLVPCSPDRHWWSRYVEGRCEIRLLTRRTLRSGRIHFVKEDGTSGRAPFASAVLVYRASRGESA